MTMVSETDTSLPLPGAAGLSEALDPASGLCRVKSTKNHDKTRVTIWLNGS